MGGTSAFFVSSLPTPTLFNSPKNGGWGGSEKKGRREGAGKAFLRTNEVAGRSKKVIWFRSRERDEQETGWWEWPLGCLPASPFPHLKCPLVCNSKQSLLPSRETSIGFEGRFCSEKR